MADSGAAIILLTAVAGGIVAFARRRTGTADGYFLAGRGTGVVTNGSAILGECVTAALLVSLVAFAYGPGFDAVLLVAGVAGGLGVALFVAPAFRRSGCYTIADFAYARFGSDRIRLTTAIVLLLTCLCYLVPLVYSAGALWAFLGGARVPGLTSYGTGVAVAGLVSAMCAVASGMKGATLSQAVWSVGLGMMTLVVLATAIATGPIAQPDGGEALPGATAYLPVAASGEVTDDTTTFSADTAGGHTVLNRLSMALSLAFGVAALPHMLMRHGAARSDASARRSIVWALVSVCAFAGVAGTAGLSVREPWMADVLAAGLFAVVSSSVAGVLVAVASTVGHDIYGAYVDPHASDDRKVLAGRVTMIGFVALSVSAALAIPEGGLAIGHQALITLMTASAFSVASAAFLPVLIAGISWKRSTERGALAGMIVGGGGSALFVLASILAQFGHVRAEGALAFAGSLAFPTVLTFPAALLAIVVVSGVDGQLPKNLDDAWRTIHGAPGRLKAGRRSLPVSDARGRARSPRRA
ncbi:MAG TPA: hypothetical protein VFH17_03450 [Coriobacteriia bacterium]|nr:hypothetical protein [Coriobacteriia bacterium]